MSPALSTAPLIQCRVTLPGDTRCLLTPLDHPSCLHCGSERGHEYESLGVPCLDCPAAISWSAGDWRDSAGQTGHRPDPSFLP